MYILLYVSSLCVLLVSIFNAYIYVYVSSRRKWYLRFFVCVSQVPEKTSEFVRVEIVVYIYIYGRGRNGVRGWTPANRAKFYTCKKACRQVGS